MEVGDHCEGVAAFVTQPNRARPSPIICRGVDFEPTFPGIYGTQCHLEITMYYYYLHIRNLCYVCVLMQISNGKYGEMMVALEIRQPLVASHETAAGSLSFR